MLRSPAVWLFLITFAVRFVVLNRFAASPYFLPTDGDMAFYSAWAQRIAAGQWTDHQAFYGLPGYAYLLAAFYAVAGFNPYLPALLQALCEGGTAAILFLLAKETFRVRGGEEAGGSHGTIAGLLAGAGWAFFVPAQTFSVILMPTALVICAFWGLVLWLVRVPVRSIWNPWAWIGLIIGAVATIIATVLFLIPLALAALVLEPGGGSRMSLARKALAAAALVAGVLIGCSPAWLHNRLAAHEPVFLSAHGGINLYIGNNPIANGYTRIPPGMMAGQAGMLRDSISIAEKDAGRPLRRHEVSEYWAGRAKAWIRENPGAWLRLMGVKVRNLFNQFQYDDLTLLPLFRQAGIATPGIRYGLVAALALPAMFIAVARSPRLGWVLAATLLHMAALLSVFVTERYRLAAVPGLLLMGACGLVLLWEALVERRWKFAAGYGMAVTGAAAFVSWPVADPSLWALDYVNLGVKASRVGQLDLAEKNLRTGLAFVPTNAEGNFALGNVFLERGDLERAAGQFERTVALEPRHDGAWNNLGFVALERGEPALAKERFERSLALDPEDAKTWYLLARALEKLGDRPAALEAALRARMLRPGQADIEALAERLGRDAR